MRIAFDGSGLAPPLTGVGNYIRHLLTHLLRVEQTSDYWLLSPRRAQVSDWLNGRVRGMQPYFPNRLFWMQCLLPLSLRRQRPDVAHFTNAIGPLALMRNSVVTVHDLSLLCCPALYRPRERLLQRPFIAPSVRRARAIVTVSQHVKSELVRILGVERRNVHVIYEAAAPCFHEPLPEPEARARLARYGWDPGACNLLYVGRIEPRKNVARLVRALALLHERGAPAHLWLVGTPGWQSAGALRAIAEQHLAAHVHLTGYVATADLRAFYRACTLFVFPSLLEGFGLPLIEALASGAPVLASDTPTLREIGGDAARYVDPFSSGRIAEALAELLADAPLRASLRLRGPEHAARFSWDGAAQQTLNVYRAVAAK